MTVIDDPLGLPKKKMKRKAKAASSSLVIAQSHIGPHQAKQPASNSLRPRRPEKEA